MQSFVADFESGIWQGLHSVFNNPSIYIYIYISADVLSIGDKQCGAKYKKLVFRYFFIFLITDFIALIAVNNAVNNLLDIQLLPSIPSC